MKSSGEIHPNEIDALLNEINDFMFIRSNELASGESILYSDVLKAIDECGSPSEISEQYLDSEESDESETDDTYNATKNKKTFFPKKRAEGRTSEYSSIYHKSRNNISGFKNYIPVPLFTLIRFPSPMMLTLALFLLIISPLFTDDYFYSFYPNDLIWVINNFVGIIIFCSIWFTLSEGIIFDKWKNRLESNKFNRKIDDNLIIALARIGFVSICLKTSVLPMPEYLILILPIVFLCLIFLERRLKTHFWVSTISPALLKIASDMEQGNFSINLGLPRKFFQMFQDLNIFKKIYLVAFTLLFIVSLYLPGQYGWSRFRFPYYMGDNSYIEFYPEFIINQIVMLSVVTMIFLFCGILIDIKQKDRINEFDELNNSAAIWLIRIFTLRIIFLILTYNSTMELGRLLLFVIPLYLIFEIFKGRSVNSPVVTAIRYLGEGNKNVKRPSPQKTQKVASTSKRTDPQESVAITSSSPSFFARIRKNFVILFKRFIVALVLITRRIYNRVHSPLLSFLKALFVTTFLLIGSTVEIFLILFSLLTAISADGAVRLPAYAFNIGSHTYYSSEIIIWSWYLIGILALQLFILVLIEWFLYLNQRSEGFLTLFFRNLSRIILGILYIGLFIQISRGDPYAPIRLFLLIVLLLFSEITALKIRLERKKLSLNNSLQTRDISLENRGNQIPPKVKTTFE
jgi:hypothetical protein